jgi:HK97 family phage prohead protease
MDKINYRIVSHEVRKKDSDENDRTLTFVASDGTRDSSHTVLNVDGWDLDRFNKNGVIGYQHKVYGGWMDDSNPDNVIGKGNAYVKDKKLMVDVEFEPADLNPLAEKIYRKLLFGSLNAVSVGFRDLGGGSWGRGLEGPGEDNETYYYKKQELLEVSVVNIPANPNALKRSIKGQEEYDELSALRSKALKKDNPEEKEKSNDKPKEITAKEDKQMGLTELEISKAIAIAEAQIMTN